jgi:hypothetical protein
MRIAIKFSLDFARGEGQSLCDEHPVVVVLERVSIIPMKTDLRRP